MDLPDNFFELSNWEREEVLNKLNNQLESSKQHWYNNNNTCKSCGGEINEPLYPTHHCGKCRLKLKRWGSYNGRTLVVSHLLALGINVYNIYKELEHPELKAKMKPINKLISILEKRYPDAFYQYRYGLGKLANNHYSHILLCTYHMTQQAGGYIDLGEHFKSYMIYCAFDNTKFRNSRKKRMNLFDDVFVNTGLFKMLITVYPLWKEVMLGNKMLKPHYEKGDYNPFMSA